MALTTHICAADSPFQGDAKSKKCAATVGLLQALTGNAVQDEDHDGAKFHAHMLVLTDDITATFPAATGGPAVSDACTNTHNPSFGQVDLVAIVDYDATTSAELGLDPLSIVSPDWTVKVHGDKIRVGNVPTNALPDAGVEAIASYGIEGQDFNGDTIIDNLCLTTPTED